MPTWSQADWKFRAASSMAPPKRGPMVSSPLTRQDTRSLPARDVTIVLCAPARMAGFPGVSCTFQMHMASSLIDCPIVWGMRHARELLGGRMWLISDGRCSVGQPRLRRRARGRRTA